MHTLIIGSGGREHALARKIAASDLVTRVSVAPGNPGTAALAKTTNVPGGDVAAVTEWAAANAVDLVVVGPEAPLVEGLADALAKAGIPTVGPTQAGAALEGSKAFAKDLMREAGVPTAHAEVVRTADDVDAFVLEFEGDALVVKADGLAGGKGVLVCDTVAEAAEAAKTMLREQTFGAASRTVLLEERLEGPEVSYMVLTDGDRWIALPSSQDHKRLGEGDTGPNTGGMGAYCPAPFVTPELADEIEATIIEPTLAALRDRGIVYRGFLYAGLMLTAQGPMVLEFNVRLGDPETQALLAAIDDDIVPALRDAAQGTLTPTTWSARSAAVVVLAAAGYPTSPVKGDAIVGLDEADALDDVHVIRAGVRDDEGVMRVNGGRVLGVTGVGDTIADALDRAYAGVDAIQWPDMQVRRDIGWQVR